MPVPPLDIPREFRFVLTTYDSIWVVTGAGAFKINPMTGEIVKWIGEHPILERDLSTLATTTELLGQIEGLRGADELRLQAGKFIANLAEKIESEITRAAKQAA